MQLMLVSSETTADDVLVCAAAEGDRGAFGELYVRYARMVHGILLARVPPGEAEDLVQEVFLSATAVGTDTLLCASLRGASSATLDAIERICRGAGAPGGG